MACGAPEPSAPGDDSQAAPCPPLVLEPAPPGTELAWRVQLHVDGEEPGAPRMVWTRDTPIGEVDGVLRWIRSSPISHEAWERTDTTTARRLEGAWLTWQGRATAAAQAAGTVDTLRRLPRDPDCCALEATWTNPSPSDHWSKLLQREETWTFCPDPVGLREWQRTVHTPVGSLREHWQRAPGLDLR